MKTLKLEIELTYDGQAIHGDDPGAIDWFYNDILKDKTGCNQELVLHSNEIGDFIGFVKVAKINEG